MNEYDQYISPFSERYASEEMQYLFSANKKFSTWRKLWVALAESEKELGLTSITDEMISEMREHIFDIDYEVCEEYELAEVCLYLYFIDWMLFFELTLDILPITFKYVVFSQLFNLLSDISAEGNTQSNIVIVLLAEAVFPLESVTLIVTLAFADKFTAP